MLASDVYRHQARRLRQQYASQPSVLQYNLRELSRRYDRANSSVLSGAQPVTAIRARPSSDKTFARAVVDWFADQVASQFSGKLLHHSQRQELLNTAERLGIGRFHANLIIAVAQHEADSQPGRTTQILPIQRRFSRVKIAMMIVVQSLICWGVWRVLHFA